MRSAAITVAVNAVAIWVATLVVPGLAIDTAADEGVANVVFTLVVVGLVFGLVNAVIKPVVKLLSLPLYLLTFGLFAFVVNAFMLQITSWISRATPLAFTVDSFFWDAILGAVVVTLVTTVLQIVLPD